MIGGGVFHSITILKEPVFYHLTTSWSRLAIAEKCFQEKPKVWVKLRTSWEQISIFWNYIGNNAWENKTKDYKIKQKPLTYSLGQSEAGGYGYKN